VQLDGGVAAVVGTVRLVRCGLPGHPTEMGEASASARPRHQRVVRGPCLRRDVRRTWSYPGSVEG
jgi:hypothetical protein